ncbi:hypothetical protein [Frigoribacterium salinisoli]
MLWTALSALRSVLPPLEIAASFGLVLFVLSWLLPHRIASMPRDPRRRATATTVGIGGGLLIAATATVASTLASTIPDTSGFDGWWQRPLPLLVAVVVVGLAGLALRGTASPPAGDRALSPRRPWDAFAPRGLLRVGAGAVCALLVVAGWHTVTATSAPVEGPFFGEVPRWTELPIYTRFSGSFGYLAGAGWPNHLATLVVAVLAVVVLVVVLRTDADRPAATHDPASAVRADRAPLARMLTLVLLVGLLSTLGAVLMHVGASGYGSVGLPGDGTSDDPDGLVFVSSAYDAIARPMNLLGYATQGVGFALGLRLAVDTLRARVRRAGGATSRPGSVATAQGGRG